MTEATPTAQFRACHLEDARAILNKLADRAFGYGQIISWTEEPFDREMRRIRWDGKMVKLTEKWVKIFVTGAAPTIGDYTFLAMLERLPGGVMVKSLPEVEIGEFGSDWDGHCDHCGKPRDRVHGYIVEGKDGRKIIGKSCVRDYLGMDVPEKLLSVIGKLVEVSDFEDDDYFGGGGGSWTQHVVGVVAAARCVVAMLGYAKTDQGALSTKSRVLFLMGSGKGKLSFEEAALQKEFHDNAERYYREAHEIVDWAKTIKASSDYLNNLRVLCSCDSVDQKKLGVLVSVVVAYDNEQARKRRAAEGALKSAGHVGVIKQRMTADVVVERIISVNNMYGCYRVFLFRTTEGAVLRWKTGFDTETEINGQKANTGDQVRLTFTPQRHGEYEGQPQTYVNRCKMEALAVPA